MTDRHKPSPAPSRPELTVADVTVFPFLGKKPGLRSVVWVSDGKESPACTRP